jgi:hypothetical protein
VGRVPREAESPRTTSRAFACKFLGTIGGMAPTGQAVSRAPAVELRCDKCHRLGRPRPPTFDTVWIWEGRLYGPRVETDLADEIAAFEAGQPYETPAWMNSNLYIEKCKRCRNRPELKLDKLTRMVAEAIESGERILYI